MASDDDKRKVIEFAARRNPAAPQLSKPNLALLRQVNVIAHKRLGLVAARAFEQVDDALFDLAERAGSSTSQLQFFDGMREIRRKRQRIEDRFGVLVDQSFADYAAGRPLAAVPATPFREGGESSLALIEDADLEEAIALSNMAGRADAHFAQGLYLLNRRLAALGTPDKAGETTPLSPSVVCHGFGNALHELDVTLQVRLILLKLFERGFMASFEQTCDEANRALVEAGVLPQLRFMAPPRAQSAPDEFPPPAPAPPADGPFPNASAPSDALGVRALEPMPEWFGQLQALVAERRQAALETGVALPTASASSLSEHDLQDALARLQYELSRRPWSPMPVQEIKRAVIEQARRPNSASTTLQLEIADENIIDLVAMLFEFLIEDRQLPAAIQALLARLQIPYMRIALQERQIFTQQTHPARQLLDMLTDAGMRWSEAADKDGRILAKIRAVVDTLLREHVDDVHLFEQLADDFSEFATKLRRRAELAEQRAAEAARGREKLEAARLEAAWVVGRGLLLKGLPEIVREILTVPWIKYLEIVHSRRGPNSNEWHVATKLVRDLVWSVDRETVAREGRHWATLLPGIEAMLRQGFAAVGYHDTESLRLISQLRQTYASVLEATNPGTSASIGGIVPQGHDKAANDPHDAPAAIARLPEPARAAVDDAQLVPPGELAKAPEEIAPQPAPEHLDAVRALKRGQWLEFRDDAGHVPTRGKLAWWSEITQRYLFVNQTGLKVVEKTLHELATDLMLGRVSAIADDPLFDRALSAIVEQLRSDRRG